MKKINFLIALSFSVFACYSQKVNIVDFKDVSLEVEVITLKEASKAHLISKIKNNSRDTISFITWSCSREYLYESLSDSITFAINKFCSRNYPIVVTIKPGETRKDSLYFYIISEKSTFSLGNCRISYCLIPLIPNESILELANLTREQRNTRCKKLISNYFDLK